MSTKEERARAVTAAREFLFRLINPKATPRVPKSIRKEASDILRHYPYKA